MNETKFVLTSKEDDELTLSASANENSVCMLASLVFRRGFGCASQTSSTEIADSLASNKALLFVEDFFAPSCSL